ncbi:MAG TPA: helix-turn-helix transcriptional regulator [Nocardioidaceae bacterium]|nr:helix-turn-helix transcriptional regulator [Nocardioidaceae bacterium]
MGRLGALPGRPLPVLRRPGHLVGAFAACHRLTPREIDVMKQLMGGRSGKEIAKRLNLSLLTVNGHLKSIYRKCGVRGRDELLGRLI